MREAEADMIKNFRDYQAICITTNSITTNKGKAVMGAGIAKDCRDKFKGSDIWLAESMKLHGHRVHIFAKIEDTLLISFPTKYHFRNFSNITLIEKSISQLMELLDEYNITNVALPRPGCTNGKLDWESQIKPLLAKYIDDRVIIVTKPVKHKTIQWF